jgi:hypothetical protein
MMAYLSLDCLDLYIEIYASNHDNILLPGKEDGC